MDRGAIVSALRWLAEGAWSTAHLAGTEVVDATLTLAPSLNGGFVRHGVAVIAAGRPSQAQVHSSSDTRWRRVVLRLAEPVDARAWVQVWTRVETAGAVPAAPDPATAIGDDAPTHTPTGVWRAAAVNAIDARVLCLDDGELWVAVELGGEGTTAPRVTDVRVEVGSDGPVTALPVAYRNLGVDRATGSESTVDDGDGFVGRYLGLLDAQLSQTASILDELPMALSPSVAPDRSDAPWLERLATWVALDPALLPRGNDERRESVSTAVTRHGWRGTRRGLVDQVLRETGLAVEVIEPLQDVAIWRLDANPHTSRLGLTTGLIEGMPGPPVLDASAIIDASMLISHADDGIAVHAHRAHRICVHVPNGSSDQVAAVDAVVQRERPAHVLARTCAVHYDTDMKTVVGRDSIPGPRPVGLANDVAYDIQIDGPGVRLGTARLPNDSAPDDALETESKGEAR